MRILVPVTCTEYTPFAGQSAGRTTTFLPPPRSCARRRGKQAPQNASRPKAREFRWTLAVFPKPCCCRSMAGTPAHQVSGRQPDPMPLVRPSARSVDCSVLSPGLGFGRFHRTKRPPPCATTARPGRPAIRVFWSCGRPIVDFRWSNGASSSVRLYRKSMYPEDLMRLALAVPAARTSVRPTRKRYSSVICDDRKQIARSLRCGALRPRIV